MRLYVVLMIVILKLFFRSRDISTAMSHRRLSPNGRQSGRGGQTHRKRQTTASGLRHQLKLIKEEGEEEGERG